MEKEYFEVRDMRNKEKFFVDDAYLNGYAKHLGTTTSMVYFVLCRHADKNQECFPSMETMGEKIGVSRHTTMRSIKILEEWNIIQKGKRIRNKKGVWLHNTYTLMDKSVWKNKPSSTDATWTPSSTDAPIHVAPMHLSMSHPCDTKDTHRKDTHILSSTDDAVDFSQELKKLEDSKSRHLNIIGFYMDVRKATLRPKITTKSQLSAFIKRHAKSASALSVYTDDQIVSAKEEVETKYKDIDWTLETLIKQLTK